MDGESDSEYSVNSDDEPESQPEPKVEENQNNEENYIRNYFHKLNHDHPIAIRRFQEMIFFYRPRPYLIMLISINLLFLIYRKAHLPFIPLCCLYFIIYIIFAAIYEKASIIIEPILFGTDISGSSTYDNPKCLNHVRSTAEIDNYINIVSENSFVKSLTAAYTSLKNDKTTYAQVFLCFCYFILFFISLFIDPFWYIVISVNLLLILPGICLHPKISFLYE